MQTLLYIIFSKQEQETFTQFVWAPCGQRLRLMKYTRFNKGCNCAVESYNVEVT